MRSLQELESQLQNTFGAWSHYRLRLWQEYRSIQSAGIEERLRIAQDVLGSAHRGEWIWAWGGFVMLLGEVQAKLNAPDSHVRADAIVALADFGLHAGSAVPRLMDRLRLGTLHERTLAAWALPKIGASAEAIPALLVVLDETAGDREANELRLRSVEAIEHLSKSFRILVPLARRCLRDQYWKCRLQGLELSERLIRRDRRLIPMLMPRVKPLVGDEVEEVRKAAERTVLQNR